MPDWLAFVLASFACFRLSELITVDDGPGDILIRIRAWFGAYDLGEDGEPKTSIGRGIICAHCVSIWIAIVLALILWPIGYETLLYWIGISGATSVIIGIAGR